VADEDIQHLTD